MKKRVFCRILATVLATSLVSAGFTLHTFATEIGPETLLSESEEEDPALEPQEEAAEEDSLTENPAQIREAETEEPQTEDGDSGGLWAAVEEQGHQQVCPRQHHPGHHQIL